MKLKKRLKQFEIVQYLADISREFFHKYFISDEKLIKQRFVKHLGRNLNLTNPYKYNDKLQWLKLYWYDPLATKCSDKYEVRKYVKEKIGASYLNDLLGVYESVKEIDINKLPQSFVLKGTHGSGYNIICTNKYKMNWKQEFKRMRRWLRQNYFWPYREWVYKDIKPRIICEKYMAEQDSGELRDYKIFCFHGHPKFIQVDFDRFKNHKRNIYDLEWNLQDIEIEYPSDPNAQINKPSSLEEMLKLSRILSSEFPHVRVDFYSVNGKVIFGELTFFHGSGMEKFEPPEFEDELGNYLDLSKVNNILDN